MAAAIIPVLEEAGAALGGTGVISTVLRGILTGAAGFTAGDLLNHFLNNPQDKHTAAGAKLHYAIVDMHNNAIVKPLSSKRVYTILTHHSRSRKAKVTKVIVVPEGSHTERVK